MALTLDTTIGAGGIIVAESNSTTSVITASFSTAAAIRLVALAASNGVNDPGATTLTFDGGGLSWSKEVEVSVRQGCAAIALAYSIGALSGVTVTATRDPTDAGPEGMSLTVVGVLGAETTHTGAEAFASDNVGTPAVAITSTLDGSYLFSTMSDWQADGDPGVGAAPAETKLNGHHIAGKYSAGQSRSDTLSIGTYTMDYTGTATRNYNMAVIEICEDVGVIDGSSESVLRAGPTRPPGSS